MEYEVQFTVTISGVLKVNAETVDQAAGMAKNVLGSTVSTSVMIHPVRTHMDINVTQPSGLVTAGKGNLSELRNVNGPNRAQRRRGGS